MLSRRLYASMPTKLDGDADDSEPDLTQSMPFLPGYYHPLNSPHISKENYRKSQHFDYMHGVPQWVGTRKPGIGGQTILGQKPRSRQSQLPRVDRSLPKWVTYDKKILVFDAYFNEPVFMSTEQYKIRKCKIKFFLADDTIQVVELETRNSGMNQGRFLSKHRIRKPPPNEHEYYTADDFNVGEDITFYDRTFHITGCDKFTKQFFEDMDRKVNTPERAPDDPYQRRRDAVGPVYGRKMLKGFLESKHGQFLASEERIGKSLGRVAPIYQRRRNHNTARQTNPVPYAAEYFGHKLHFDQNEKLIMYGVTEVCCIDGFSRFIPAYDVMPVKNNLTIYNDVYRKAVLEQGLFDQVRVDHGKEFYLTLFVQELLADHRTKIARDPHRQTESKQNLRMERFWVEVNSRVNYPIKQVLNDMAIEDEIDMDQENHKFCISWVAQLFVKHGLSMVVDSWNQHIIPGIGRPCDLKISNNFAAVIQPHLVPSVDAAAMQYEDLGGHLTKYSPFGQDPLYYNEELQERAQCTCQRHLWCLSQWQQPAFQKCCHKFYPNK